jgi:hypothetical protein
MTGLTGTSDLRRGLNRPGEMDMAKHEKCPMLTPISYSSAQRASGTPPADPSW